MNADSMHEGSKKQLLAVLGLLFATFAWGASFILVKLTIKEMNLYDFLFLRFALASIMMAVIFHRQLLQTDRQTLLSALILSFFFSISFIAQTEGLKITSAANSALITCLYMVFIPLFSYFYGRHKIEAHSLIAVALAFMGMYLLTCYSLTGINFGDFLVLLCAILFAWHFILTGKYSVRHRLVPLVTFQFIFCSVI